MEPGSSPDPPLTVKKVVMSAPGGQFEGAMIFATSESSQCVQELLKASLPEHLS